MNSVVLLCLLIILLSFEVNSDANEEVIKQLLIGFGRNLYDCVEKLYPTNNIAISEYLNFWRDATIVTHRDMGCAMYCSARQLQLIDPRTGMLKKANAEGFLRANGAEDDMVQTLTEIYSKCRNEVETENLRTRTDMCRLTLEVYLCSRHAVYELHWAPADIQDVFLQLT